MVTKKRAAQGALLRGFLAGSTCAERMADDPGTVGLEPGEPYETSAELTARLLLAVAEAELAALEAEEESSAKRALALLVAAVTDHDEPAARTALNSAIMAFGGELPTKMAAYKADRAERFRLDGDGVLFDIERHPGLGLAHLTQTWRVHVLRGAIELESERLTLELSLQSIHPGHGPAPSREDVAGEVARAFEYARQSVKESGDFFGPDTLTEPFAMAWVYLSTLRGCADGRWLGLIEHVRKVVSGEPGFEIVAQELAKAVNARARTIWESLRAHDTPNISKPEGPGR